MANDASSVSYQGLLVTHLEAREAIQICQPSAVDAGSASQRQLPQLDQSAETLKIAVQQELHRGSQATQNPDHSQCICSKGCASEHCSQSGRLSVPICLYNKQEI